MVVVSTKVLPFNPISSTSGWALNTLLDWSLFCLVSRCLQASVVLRWNDSGSQYLTFEPHDVTTCKVDLVIVGFHNTVAYRWRGDRYSLVPRPRMRTHVRGLGTRYGSPCWELSTYDGD